MKKKNSTILISIYQYKKLNWFSSSNYIWLTMKRRHCYYPHKCAKKSTIFRTSLYSFFLYILYLTLENLVKWFNFSNWKNIFFQSSYCHSLLFYFVHNILTTFIYLFENDVPTKNIRVTKANEIHLFCLSFFLFKFVVLFLFYSLHSILYTLK